MFVVSFANYKSRALCHDHLGDRMISRCCTFRSLLRRRERLLNGKATSVHCQLAFVLKEPIRCSVNVDISVVCQVACLAGGIVSARDYFNGGADKREAKPRGEWGVAIL